MPTKIDRVRPGSDILALLMLSALVALAYAPAIYRDEYDDLANHAGIATSPSLGTAIRLGYPIFHIVTRGLASIVGSPLAAGVVAATLARCAVALLAFRLVRKHAGECVTSTPLAFCVALLTVALGPVNIFTPSSMYLGYATPNLAHNPTFIVAVPFAIIELLVATRLLAAKAPDARLVGTMAVAVVASSLAKPSFNIAFAPAFGLLVFWQWAKRRRELGPAITTALAVLLPFALVTAAQYAVLFGAASQVSKLNSSVILDPFTVLLAYSKGSWGMLATKLAGSVAVPTLLIAAAATAARDERERLGIMLSGIAFGVAIVQAIIFNEGNAARSLDGNFLWGMHVTAAVLVVVCIPAAMQNTALRKWQIPVVAILLLSLLGGAAIVRPFLSSDASLRQIRASLLGG
jgi:hypothetical protein